MRIQKLALVTFGVLMMNTAAFGAWGQFRCAKECINLSCDDPKLPDCNENCPGLVGECKKTTSTPLARKPSPPPRRNLPTAPVQPEKPVELPQPESSSSGGEMPSVSSGEGQAQPSRPHIQRREAMKFSRPPLEHKASTTETSEPSELRQSKSTATPELKKQPSTHHVTGSGAKGITAEEMFSLNEGKGVKVKHMKEKIEGLENLIAALEKRISLLEPLADHVFGARELLGKLQKNTGFDKPEVRNDPEHDIDYKPEQFSTASSATGTLDGITCQTLLTRVQQKAKEGKDKGKAKELAVYGGLLTEMCSQTKNLNRTPGQKVKDAEAVNNIYSKAVKLF